MATDGGNGKGLTLPRGTYSKVARRLKVSPQHVRAVWLRQAKSKRVLKALERVAVTVRESAAA